MQKICNCDCFLLEGRQSKSKNVCQKTDRQTNTFFWLTFSKQYVPVLVNFYMNSTKQSSSQWEASKWHNWPMRGGHWPDSRAVRARDPEAGQLGSVSWLDSCRSWGLGAAVTWEKKLPAIRHHYHNVVVHKVGCLVRRAQLMMVYNYFNLCVNTKIYWYRHDGLWMRRCWLKPQASSSHTNGFPKPYNIILIDQDEIH